MNSKQRVLTALAGEQPDRVPVFDWIDESITFKIIEKLGIQTKSSMGSKGLPKDEEKFENLEIYCRMVQNLGLDASWLSFSTGLKQIGNGYGRDRYGNFIAMVRAAHRFGRYEDI